MPRRKPEYMKGERCPYHDHANHVLLTGRCETCGHLCVPIRRVVRRNGNSRGMYMWTQSSYHGGME